MARTRCSARSRSSAGDERDRNETPVSSACRTFWSASIMGRLGRTRYHRRLVRGKLPRIVPSLDFAYRGLLPREGLPWLRRTLTFTHEWKGRTHDESDPDHSMQLRAGRATDLSGCVQQRLGARPGGTTYTLGHLDGPCGGLRRRSWKPPKPFSRRRTSHHLQGLHGLDGKVVGGLRSARHRDHGSRRTMRTARSHPRRYVGDAKSPATSSRRIKAKL